MPLRQPPTKEQVERLCLYRKSAETIRQGLMEVRLVQGLSDAPYYLTERVEAIRDNLSVLQGLLTDLVAYAEAVIAQGGRPR